MSKTKSVMACLLFLSSPALADSVKVDVNNYNTDSSYKACVNQCDTTDCIGFYCDQELPKYVNVMCMIDCRKNEVKK